MTRPPNFFILGTQKAGTTYLAAALANHNDVFFSDPKEPLFFSRQQGVPPHAYQKYLEQNFETAGDEQWRGEGSTTYLQWPMALKRLKRFVPQTDSEPRFIVCLRQPLEKAISFFIHNWRRSRYAPGTKLTDVVGEPITLSPYKSSLYGPSIRRWIDHFGPDRFLFLRFETLQDDPEGFVRQATDFLEIEPLSCVPNSVVNAGLPLAWQDGVLMLKRPSEEGGYQPVFTEEELAELQEMFLKDITRTERLTGFDLSSWREMPRIA